jgi:hypothetical protein
MIKIYDLYKTIIQEMTVGTFVAFHGSDHKIENFVDEFVGREEAYDANGPGIYFTTDYDEAKFFGKYIYKVKLENGRFIDNKTPNTKVNINDVIKLVKMSPNWEYKAENFDEDPNKGLKMFVDMTLEDNDSEKDVFLQVWYDFYRYEPVDYVRNMVKLGYDGLIDDSIAKDGHKHIIVYNTKIIKLIDVEEI